MVLLEVSHRVGTVAQVVTDIQTHADVRIKVLHLIPNHRSILIHLQVRSMQVDGIFDFRIFLDFLVHVRQQLVGRYAKHHLGTHSAGIGKRLVHLFLRILIDRTHAVARHPIFRTLGMESLYLLIRSIQRQVEILDAEIMDITLLQCLESCVDVKQMESPICATQMKLVVGSSGLSLFLLCRSRVATAHCQSSTTYQSCSDKCSSSDSHSILSIIIRLMAKS